MTNAQETPDTGTPRREAEARSTLGALLLERTPDDA